MKAKDFLNTRWEKLAKDIETIEKEHDFDRALKLAKMQSRNMVVYTRNELEKIDHDFISWLNPYER